MLKSMLGSLILKKRIATTEAKAKELRPMAEKTIYRIAKLRDKNRPSRSDLVRKLLVGLPRNLNAKKLDNLAKKIPPRKNSGFTKISKAGQRRSDGATMAILEIIQIEDKK